MRPQSLSLGRQSTPPPPLSFRTAGEGGGNYGNVRTGNTAANGRGLLVANFSKFASFKNVVVSGTLGMAGGEVFDVNAGNFMEYIGGNSAGKETISGLTYVAPAQ